MNQAEARRRAWAHLALLALAMKDEDLRERGLARDEFDRRRMKRAFSQVAESIEKRMAKASPFTRKDGGT